EPAAAFAGFGGQAEGELRHVDDNPIGIGEREGGEIDGAGEVGNEPGARFVPPKTGFAPGGKTLRPSLRGGPRPPPSRPTTGDGEDPAERGEQALLCANTHRGFLTCAFITPIGARG